MLCSHTFTVEEGRNGSRWWGGGTSDPHFSKSYFCPPLFYSVHLYYFSPPLNPNLHPPYSNMNTVETCCFFPCFRRKLQWWQSQVLINLICLSSSSPLISLRSALVRLQCLPEFSFSLSIPPPHIFPPSPLCWIGCRQVCGMLQPSRWSLLHVVLSHWSEWWTRGVDLQIPQQGGSLRTMPPQLHTGVRLDSECSHS